MSQTRTWILLTALLVLALLAAGWFLLVSPQRAEAAEVRESTLVQEQANDLLAVKIQQLEAQARDLPAQEARLADIRGRIPPAPELPSLIRSLTAATEQSGSDLRSLSPGAPTATLDPAAVLTAPAPAAADGSGIPGVDDSGTADEGAAAVAPAPPAAAPLFYVPITLEARGSFPQLQMLLNELEDLDRAFLVTGATFAAEQETGGAPSGLTATLQGRVFVSPPPATPADAAAAAAPPAAGAAAAAQPPPLPPAPTANQ